MYSPMSAAGVLAAEGLLLWVQCTGTFSLLILCSFQPKHIIAAALDDPCATCFIYILNTHLYRLSALRGMSTFQHCYPNSTRPCCAGCMKHDTVAAAEPQLVCRTHKLACAELFLVSPFLLLPLVWPLYILCLHMLGPPPRPTPASRCGQQPRYGGHILHCAAACTASTVHRQPVPYSR